MESLEQSIETIKRRTTQARIKGITTYTKSTSLEHLEYGFPRGSNQLTVVMHQHYQPTKNNQYSSRFFELIKGQSLEYGGHYGELTRLLFLQILWKMSSNQVSNLKDGLTPTSRRLSQRGGLDHSSIMRRTRLSTTTVTGWRFFRPLPQKPGEDTKKVPCIELGKLPLHDEGRDRPRLKSLRLQKPANLMDLTAPRIRYSIMDKKDFMGPFLSSNGNKYILVAIDYVSKWVEAQAFPTSDARNVVNFLRRLFIRFGIPKAFISDRGQMTSPRTRNRAIKSVFSKVPLGTTEGLVIQFSDALWAIRDLHLKPLGHNRLGIFLWQRHAFFLSSRTQAYWAIKNCNMDLTKAGENRFLQINELDEMRLDAYESSISYKERTKRWHDKQIKLPINYEKGYKVLLFNSRLRLFPGKLKSRWYGPFTVIFDEKKLESS
ncbi:reverse transcriptase domain-containing protein [Tanacetum coccineum]